MAPQTEPAMAAPAVLPKRGGGGLGVTHRETSASHNPFAKPARIPPRNRAESPKTIPKTVWKTVKASNNRPSLHMVGAYATAVSSPLTQGRTSLALPWRPSASGNVPAKTRRNGTPPRPHETLAPTPCAEKTRYTAPIGGLSGRITGRQRNENRGCATNVPQVWPKRGLSVV